MLINCPHCNQSLEAASDDAGYEVTCPECGKAFVIPPEAPDTIPCPFCSELIKATARKCKHCGEFLDGSSPKQEQTTPKPEPSPTQIGTPACQQCSAAMRKTVVSSGNCAGIVIALIVFAVGIIIAFAIPIIGWVIGPIICIGALFMGGKRQKVWKCTKCGSIVNRA